MKIHTFEDKNEWMNASIQEIISDLSENTFSLALSGGSTPSPVYEKLAKRDLHWSKADIFQVDERFISPERDESNRRLIEKSFIGHLTSPIRSFHYFKTEEDITWETSAEKYDSFLRKYDRGFDVCILGIGPDGHTASLFPGEPASSETDKLAMTSETNQFPVWKRMTITFPQILKSKKLIVLLRGKDKKEILEELLHGKKTWEKFPSKKLLEHNNLHILFLEE